MKIITEIKKTCCFNRFAFLVMSLGLIATFTACSSDDDSDIPVYSLKDVEEQFFSLYVIPYFSQTWADVYFPDKKSSQAWILISGGNFGLDIKIPLK